MWLVMTDPYHDNNLILGLYNTEAEARVKAEEEWSDRHRNDIGIWQIGLGHYESETGWADYIYHGSEWTTP